MQISETVFVPVMKQPNLPHQFDLKFVLGKTRVRPVCNCGWTGWAYKPDDVDGLPFARAQYTAHLDHELLSLAREG